MYEKIEALLPIVEELTNRYTSGDSTSVSQETAKQLVEAVIYTIKVAEGQLAGSQTLINNHMTIGAQYALGKRLIQEKTKEALACFNALCNVGTNYEQIYLKQSKKELLHFFNYYDVEYNPQDHLVFLDYPVLAKVSGFTGIEYIWIYVHSLYRELSFLNQLPQEQVVKTLEVGEKDYRTLPINLCTVFAQGTFPDEQAKQEKLLAMIMEA